MPWSLRSLARTWDATQAGDEAFDEREAERVAPAKEGPPEA